MPLRTIMIIDDTPDHRDFLSRLLRGRGYRFSIPRTQGA